MDYVDNDATFEPIVIEAVSESPSPQHCTKKIKKSYRKKVEKEWSHEATIKLIEEIEIRRSLWDVGCSEYKLPKELLWQEVADATNMTIGECKGKWANLRITFNCNLEKHRKKKSGQGTCETTPIVWKYFRPMMFLESNKVMQSTKSTSSLQLNTALNDDSFLQSLEEEIPSEKFIRRKTAISTPVNSDTSHSRGSNIKDMAVEALQSIRLASANPKTPNVLYCEYMASELDRLTPEQATLARLKLRRCFNEILEEIDLPSSSQPVEYIIHDPAATNTESFYEHDSNDF